MAKVNPSGTALLYAGYIGGSHSENRSKGGDIAVDSAGNAYVTGTTDSSESDFFPVMVGPDLTFNGGSDTFVAKVNPSGTALLYTGYIGGEFSDNSRGIAVDSAGNAYVTGTTSSRESTFPVTVGPDLTFNGGSDTFVAKVNVSGTALVYAGYIGGMNFDDGQGIAVDSAGNAYVTGMATSGERTFPVTVGPDLTYNFGSGGGDAFVAKVNPSGTALLYAGYIGGSINENNSSPVESTGGGIAVDSAGNAYVTGNTNSSESDFFPVTVGPDLTYNGGSDAFVAKIGLGPSISSISPSSAVAGAAGFTLTVNGADFMAGAVVRWNGEERVTTFLGDTVLEASIPASDIAVAGTAEVTVFNPLPGGGSSNVVVFNVLVFNPEGGCLNIAGEWGVEETGTLACTLTAEGETETFTDPISGSASVTILQEPGACSFSFNREVPGFGITVRNGEIEGNRLTFSGIAGIPIPGATLTSNNLEATGQVEGDVMNVSASSLLEGTAPAPEAPGGIVNVSCTTTTNAVFSRSAPPPPPAVTPTLPPNSVVNGASFRPATDLGGALAPGSIVAIFGTNLADDLQLATAVPLPTTLGNTSVTFNGISAPLFFVASTQINAQVPFDAMPGEVSAQVKRGSETSTAQTVSVAAVSPGIFALNQKVSQTQLQVGTAG